VSAAAAPPVSLVIVSRQRPRHLRRALTAVAQLDHPEVEVIVVADPAAADDVSAAAWDVRLCVFDIANVSAARNLGLAHAAAPVVAFLDDDAVPEPTWLTRLTAPFADPEVTAAAGFVRGRSGLAWQWRAMMVTPQGFDRPLAVPEGVSLHRSGAGSAVKAQGTNAAFRADALRAAGGFDPAFRFYLDDADVSLRLAARGGLTAVVPGAVVHHGFAEGPYRRADRVPRDLFEIGRSLALFLRRHAGGPSEAALARHRSAERRRALAHMVAGRLEPRDVGRLLARFDAGLAEGETEPLSPLPPLEDAPPRFLPFPDTGPRGGLALSGWLWQRARLEAEAAAARRAGRIVTLIALGPGLRPHRMSFGDDGIWRQTGGLWGRSERTEPAPRVGRTARLALEVARLSTIRPVGG
jgi:glycosyltransferase involved in cell wall biosynthesis